MNGFVFVGEIEEGNVQAHIYFNGNLLTMTGRVWFTLDEWLEARCLSANFDDVWVATKAEYDEVLREVKA